MRRRHEEEENEGEKTFLGSTPSLARRSFFSASSCILIRSSASFFSCFAFFSRSNSKNKDVNQRDGNGEKGGSGGWRRRRERETEKERVVRIG